MSLVRGSTDPGTSKVTYAAKHKLSTDKCKGKYKKDKTVNAGHTSNKWIEVTETDEFSASHNFPGVWPHVQCGTALESLEEILSPEILDHLVNNVW